MEDSELFATLSFKGDRFNGAYIPVDVLPIIAAYQETLIELAKAIWRDENPGKLKLPKNFSKMFDLGLESIGQGSKVARLPRRIDQMPDLFGGADFDAENIFLEAQELLSKVVNAANGNGQMVTLPDNVVVPFDRLAKALRGSEHIEVNPIASGKKRGAKFKLSDRSVKRIIDFSRRRNTRMIADVGLIVGQTEAPPSLRIASSFGVFSYHIDWNELRSKSATDFKIGSLVSFSIVAQVDASELIRSITRYEHISPNREDELLLNLKQRINEFSAMQSGWLDGVGDAVSRSAVMRALDMAAFLKTKFDDVSVFPSYEGGIQFEWIYQKISLSLLVYGDSFLLGASDLTSDKFREKQFQVVSLSFLRALSNPSGFVGTDL